MQQGASTETENTAKETNSINAYSFIHLFVFLSDEMCRRMEMISYSFEVMKALLQPFKLQFFPEQMAKR